MLSLTATSALKPSIVQRHDLVLRAAAQRQRRLERKESRELDVDDDVTGRQRRRNRETLVVGLVSDRRAARLRRDDRRRPSECRRRSDRRSPGAARPGSGSRLFLFCAYSGVATNTATVTRREEAEKKSFHFLNVSALRFGLIL